MCSLFLSVLSLQFFFADNTITLRTLRKQRRKKHNCNTTEKNISFKSKNAILSFDKNHKNKIIKKCWTLFV